MAIRVINKARMAINRTYIIMSITAISFRMMGMERKSNYSHYSNFFPFQSELITAISFRYYFAAWQCGQSPFTV